MLDFLRSHSSVILSTLGEKEKTHKQKDTLKSLQGSEIGREREKASQQIALRNVSLASGT